MNLLSAVFFFSTTTGNNFRMALEHALCSYMIDQWSCSSFYLFLFSFYFFRLNFICLRFLEFIIRAALTHKNKIEEKEGEFKKNSSRFGLFKCAAWAAANVAYD